MMDQIRVFAGPEVVGVGAPLVVLTAWRGMPGEQWFGEYFVFVDGPAHAFLSQRMTIDARAAASQVVIDEVYLLIETQRQAEAALQNVISKRVVQSQERALYRAHFSLEAADISAVERLWAAGRFHAECETMKLQTGSVSWRREMGRIAKMPRAVD